jgi:hypothetical protein
MPYSNPISITRAAAVLLLSLLAFASPTLAANASQTEEIEALKKQLKELQVRVERLEGELEQGVPVGAARKIEPVPGGWRKEHNWNLLEKGMSDYEVVAILGEPDREKTVKKFEFWYYGDGKVSVYLRRLKGWEMPSGID